MKNDRPKIQVPLEGIDLIMDLTVLAILLFIWGYVLTSYASLPETIPSHFNIQGEADGYSGKSSLWFLLMTTTVLAVGMYVLTKFPHIHNYMEEITEENALRNYKMSCRLVRFVNLFTIIVMLYVVYSIIEKSEGNGIILESSFMYIVIAFSVLLPIILYLLSLKKKKDASSKK
ncbi:DUF1648 domain-containing protein [Kordia jejudonensis]|uniref:DUF1648 domain-containing protein n=1 Tax=Kordia jejudonensis TaxID=1348245 RepID=UPI00069A2167|nr:DUF1648 domain-containing protein [Kordia jejudonensis]